MSGQLLAVVSIVVCIPSSIHATLQLGRILVRALDRRPRRPVRAWRTERVRRDRSSDTRS